MFSFRVFSRNLLIFLAFALIFTPVNNVCRADSFPQDFILGVDVSELIAQENSGARYLDADGNEKDALEILSAYGIDHIRLRVWNNPFDLRGRGYGGGNINADTAAILSARAAALGMKTLLDFHYSDFWADPSRQIVPKAWKGMSLEEKSEALYAYTKDSLTHVLEAGGNVDMVQVGNEINFGMAGEYDPGNKAVLVAAGCRAVRDFASENGLEIRTAVHLTDPEDPSQIIETLQSFIDAGADFDAVGLSYYPYWHGSMHNLMDLIRSIREDLGKEVFIAETAWPFTPEDGDGAGNVIGQDPGTFPATPEGQAQAILAVSAAAANAGAEGIYYWGGIWTPIGTDYSTNLPLWEKYGSGWASRYAHNYDPEHVSIETGGCAWDNQALFDFGGHPLPVLDLFRRIADGELTYDPETAIPAEEAKEELPAEETGGNENLVRNADLEDEDRSMWETVSFTGDIPFDYQKKANDAHSGKIAFHYWSAQDMDFAIEQTLTGLPAGNYEASVWSQGGDMKNASLTLYVKADGQTYEASFMNTKWADWQHPVIPDIPVEQGTLTIGVHIVCGAKGWGTLDDFSVVPAPVF